MNETIGKSRDHKPVCRNRGAALVPAGLPGTFYADDPRKGGVPPLCTAWTLTPLLPGQCETVSCTWSSPPGMVSVDLWVRADDDGRGLATLRPPLVECRPANNLLFLPNVQCLRVQ